MRVMRDQNLVVVASCCVAEARYQVMSGISLFFFGEK
jgi:hypothetical protein